MIGKRGKIGLLIAVSMVILVGMFLFLSAVITSNTKEYDSVNKVVTIKSSSGEVISDITLNTPQVFKVMRGKDRKVAEFTIDNKLASQQISSGLEKLDFYDIKNGMQKFDRQFTYKYKNSLGFKTVNDYERVCVDKENQNGTVSRVCNKILKGTHQEEVFEWVDLISLGEIPSGKTTIGIFTDVKPNERIEWVPTFFGLEINEWAVWKESLNTNLVVYYKMDETSGTVLEDSVGADNNATLVNTPTSISGLLGNAWRFNGVDEEATSPDATNLNFGTGDFSVNLWVNRSVSNGHEIIEKIQSGSPFTGWAMLSVSGTGDVLVYFNSGSGQSTGTTINDNAWHMITMRRSSGNVTTFIDKEQVHSMTRAGDVNDTSLLRIARFDGWANYGAVDVDEVGIWSRALSDSEISDLYNGGTGITYTDDFQNYTITFNLTDSITGVQLDLTNPNDDYALSCDNGFSVGEIDDNPHNATELGNGVVECTFSGLDINNEPYFNKIQNITADSNKTVEIQMSPTTGLSQEEHDWLEAIHNCMINGNGCASWTLN